MYTVKHTNLFISNDCLKIVPRDLSYAKLTVHHNNCFSVQVQEGDVLDVVKEDRITNKEGNLIMLVMRVEMKKIKEEKTPSDRTPVKLRRWKHLELPREK